MWPTFQNQVQKEVQNESFLQLEPGIHTLDNFANGYRKNCKAVNALVDTQSKSIRTQSHTEMCLIACPQNTYNQSLKQKKKKILQVGN